MAIDYNAITAEEFATLRNNYVKGFKYAGMNTKPTDRSDKFIADMVQGILISKPDLTMDQLNVFMFWNAVKISKTGYPGTKYGYGAANKFDFSRTIPEIAEDLNTSEESAPVPEGLGQPQIPKPTSENGPGPMFEGKTAQEMALIYAKLAAKERLELERVRMEKEAELRAKQRGKELDKLNKKLDKIKAAQGTLEVLEGEYHCNGWLRISVHKEAAYMMLNGEIVSLYGPRGTGKTEYWVNLCRDLKWDIFIITAPMFKSDLTGFIDATGKFNTTAFVEGFQKGEDKPCVVLIEEIDRATPEALIAINSALANGIMDTPIGNIFRGDGCHIVFTANTNGNGGSMEYNTANELDASTIDRAQWLYCGYEELVMKSLAGDNVELLSFAKDILQALKSIGQCRGVGMTYRVLRDLKLNEMLFEDKKIKNPLVKAIACSMLKGAPEAEIRSIYDALKDKDNRYAKAFASVPKVLGASGGY